VIVWVYFESSDAEFPATGVPSEHKNRRESRPRNRLNQLNIKFKFMHDFICPFPFPSHIRFVAILSWRCALKVNFRLIDPSSPQTNQTKPNHRIEIPLKFISKSTPTTPCSINTHALQRRLIPSHSVNMSRFFHGDSSSESSSSDEEELYSEEEVEEKVADEEDSDEEEDDDDEDSSSEDEDGVKKTGANRFFRDAESESDESSDEDRAKVVKSAKDKRLEELEGTVKAIENGQKISDWGVISNGML
jgi:hypothetical protein